jgi:hypothetical protein
VFDSLEHRSGELRSQGPRIEKRAGLNSATATKGGELKFTKPGHFLEFLNNNARERELGAQTVTGLRENVAYPKQTGKSSGTWVAENPGSDVADTNLTLSQVPSSPKTDQSARFRSLISGTGD